MASGCSSRPAPSRIGGASWTITCAIAPAPKPNRNAAMLGLERRRADPRAEHRGRAGDQPEQREPARRRAAASRATGATIASPSVVLWSAKPTTSEAPSASDPTA